METTILKTDGKIYVKLGGRYIALIDEHGNFNVKLRSIIKLIDSYNELTIDGFYFYLNQLFSYINGNLDLLSSDAELALKLKDKIDKEPGKGLSTNDFSDIDKEKLNNIEEGAEVNVLSNWQEQDTSNDAYIKNKPAIPKKTSELINDNGYLSDATPISILEIDELCNF